MAHLDAAADCFVCRKHWEQGPLLPGGPVAEDDLVVVSHLAPEAPGRDGAPVSARVPQFSRARLTPAGAPSLTATP